MMKYMLQRKLYQLCMVAFFYPTECGVQNGTPALYYNIHLYGYLFILFFFFVGTIYSTRPIFIRRVRLEICKTDDKYVIGNFRNTRINDPRLRTTITIGFVYYAVFESYIWKHRG